MATFKIHGGDFIGGDCSGYGFRLLTISARAIKSIEVLNESSAKKMGGTLGWGAVGALTLGPVGGLAGLLLGGKSSNVTVHCVFKDGRKFVATIDAKTYAKLRGGML
jgi:hypothetical protein